MATYVETLCREIAVTRPLGDRPLETVFFGGGTPSLLSVAQTAQILTVLGDRFGIADTAEISMEMDPGTFGRSQLQALHRLGINRVSLGVQAFQDELLAACGRTHRRADVDQAIADLQAVGLTHWSLDLISGLPHQTLTLWKDALETAIAYGPSHLSVYDLTVETGTVFAHRYRPGVAPLPSDDTTTAMYRQAQATLTQAGYYHYEISNYARPGYPCRHNLTYWHNRPYYGFGMGATSYTQHQRFSRPRTTDSYRQWVDAYGRQGGILDCEPTPPPEQWLDTLMVGLRLAVGVDLTALAQNFGPEPVADLQRLLQPEQRRGWVEVTPAPTPHLRLTDPEGFLFSNQVLLKLFDHWGDG
jgi:oxygen-independent coproporphyrinogen-3 oxidase